MCLSVAKVNHLIDIMPTTHTSEAAADFDNMVAESLCTIAAEIINDWMMVEMALPVITEDKNNAHFRADLTKTQDAAPAPYLGSVTHTHSLMQHILEHSRADLDITTSTSYRHAHNSLIKTNIWRHAR